MLIYLLPFIFSLVLYYYIKNNDYDIVSPIVLFCFGYIISSLCAIANVERWNINLHINTFYILICGMLIYVAIGCLTKNIFFKNNKDIIKENNFSRIIYNCKILKSFIAFQFTSVILWIYTIIEITSTSNTSYNFFDAMVIFREWSSYSIEWLKNKNYIILNQIIQVSIYSSWLTAYILLYNYMVYRKRNIDYYLVISLGLSILQMLLTGGRGGVVFLGLGCLVYYVIFYTYTYGVRITFNKKILIKGIVSFIIFSALFFLTKVIVGRGFRDISLDIFIPYITVYAGGPIQLLDMFLKDPISRSVIIGKETFYGINMLFSRLGILDIDPYIVHLEFRTASTGAFLGNVYTSYRSYIYDFGYAGMVILTAIFSFISHWIYYKCIEYRHFQNINFYLIMYAIMSYCIFFDFVRNYFYLSIFSATGLKQFFIIFTLSFILVKRK